MSRDAWETAIFGVKFCVPVLIGLTGIVLALNYFFPSKPGC